MEFWATCPRCVNAGYHHCTYNPRNQDGETVRETVDIYVAERVAPIMTTTTGPRPTLYDRQCVFCGHGWSD